MNVNSTNGIILKFKELNLSEIIFFIKTTEFVFFNVIKKARLFIDMTIAMRIFF